MNQMSHPSFDLLIVPSWVCHMLSPTENDMLKIKPNVHDQWKMHILNACMLNC